MILRLVVFISVVFNLSVLCLGSVFFNKFIVLVVIGFENEVFVVLVRLLFKFGWVVMMFIFGVVILGFNRLFIEGLCDVKLVIVLERIKCLIVRLNVLFVLSVVFVVNVMLIEGIVIFGLELFIGVGVLLLLLFVIIINFVFLVCVVNILIVNVYVLWLMIIFLLVKFMLLVNVLYVVWFVFG